MMTAWGKESRHYIQRGGDKKRIAGARYLTRAV